MTARRQAAWMIVLALAAAAGCSDVSWNPWAPKPAEQQPQPGPQPNPLAGPAVRSPPANPPPAKSDATVFAIMLSIFNDPELHAQHAEYSRKVLSENLKWQGLSVVTQAGHSELLWGRYRTVEEAQGNLKTAKAYRAQDGSAPFAMAMVIPLPGEDIGPGEWNLKNVKAAYTLLLAVFQDDPQNNYVGRKRFAVDYCKRLRAGGYEAYFYHGPGASHVTIGAFGAESVALDPGAADGETYRDPKLNALKKDFPQLAVNGLGVNDIVYDQTGKPISIPRQTVPIRIPHDEAGRGR